MTERMSNDGDRIAEIAAAHDLERETLRSIVKDLQEGAENPQVCEACGRTANADAEHYVARVPLADGGEGVRCMECFVDLLDRETILSTSQAIVAAYLYATDLTRREISRITGVGSISSHRSRALEKIGEAQKDHTESDTILPRLNHEL